MNRRSDVRMSWPVVNVATAVPAAGTPLVSYRMTLSDLQGHHHHVRGKTVRGQRTSRPYFTRSDTPV